MAGQVSVFWFASTDMRQRVGNLLVEGVHAFVAAGLGIAVIPWESVELESSCVAQEPCNGAVHAKLVYRDGVKA